MTATPRVEILETETQRGMRFPADMSIADRIKAAKQIFDAGLIEDLAVIERDFRAEYYADDEMVDAVLWRVRERAAMRRAQLIAEIERDGAPLQ
jgi:hypothetical protein